MKKSIIEEIFHGKIHIETMIMPEERRVFTAEVSDAYDKLKKELNEEQFALHDKCISALRAEFLEETDFYFAEGFKLGMRICMECMED